VKRSISVFSLLLSRDEPLPGRKKRQAEKPALHGWFRINCLIDLHAVIHCNSAFQYIETIENDRQKHLQAGEEITPDSVPDLSDFSDIQQYLPTLFSHSQGKDHD
jgi:hypothetical protein